jgi:hypothetical protein
MAVASKPSNPILQVRLRPDLAAEVARLVRESDSDTSSFLRRAVENEVSRVTLRPPLRDVSTGDLAKQLDVLTQAVARVETRERVTQAVLKAVAQGMGLTIPEGAL